MKLDEVVGDYVYVMVENEESPYVLMMTSKEASQCKQLLDRAQRHGEWPEAVDNIMGNANKLPIVGVINTAGDGWGWYSPEQS